MGRIYRARGRRTRPSGLTFPGSSNLAPAPIPNGHFRQGPAFHARPHEGPARRRVSHDAPLPSPRRQGDPAQAAEQDLLPDLRRRPRGRAHGRRDGLQAGPRLVLYVLPRPRALPAAGDDAGRDALLRRRRGHRSQLRRPPDAVALGPQEAQHRLHLLPHRDAVPPGRGLRRSLAQGQGARHHGRLRQGRGRLRLHRRRHHLRGRVLGVAQLGLQPQDAGGLPRRGQRLRHLGAGRGEHGRRVHLQARRRVPRPVHPGSGRLRPARLVRRHAEGRLVRPRAQGPRARPRQGHPPVFALAVGRRGDVPPGDRAQRRRRARPARHLPQVAARRGLRHRGAARPDARGGGRRGPRRHGRRAGAAAAGPLHRALRRLLARRGPDLGAVRHRGRPAVLPGTRRRWWTCSTRQ